MCFNTPVYIATKCVPTKAKWDSVTFSLAQGSLATWDRAWIVFFYSKINQRGLNTPLTMKSKKVLAQAKKVSSLLFLSFTYFLSSSTPLRILQRFTAATKCLPCFPAVCQLRWLAPHVFILPLRFCCESNKHEGIDSSSRRCKDVALESWAHQKALWSQVY